MLCRMMMMVILLMIVMVLMLLLLLLVNGQHTGRQRERGHDHFPRVRGAELPVRPE